MRVTRKPFALSLIALAIGLAGSAFAAPVATVNGKPIPEEALKQYMTEHNIREEQLNSPDARREVIEQLVARELVFQDATSKKLDKSADIESELERARHELTIRAGVKAALDATPITDEAMKQEYEAQKPKLEQQEFKARHILVKDEDEAKAIIKQLDDGGDFAAIAKEKSTDGSAGQGGDLGWFGERQMVPQFTAAVKALENGKYSKEPVKSQFGYHVILREDSRKADAPPFDQVKPQIKQYLQQKQLAEYIDGLRGKATIELK